MLLFLNRYFLEIEQFPKATHGINKEAEKLSFLNKISGIDFRML